MDSLVRLKQNIRAYLRRTYLSQFISGSLITAGLLGFLWVLFSLLEYLFRFGTQARAVLFYGFVVIAIGLLVIQIVIPLLRFLGLLNHKKPNDVAKEIGSKIAFIEDRLLNVLSLESTLPNSHSALTEASLRQKANQLNGFNFSDAVDFRASFRWIGLTLIPLLISVFLYMWDANLLSDGSARLVSYNQSFIAPAPFQFDIKNEVLEVAEGASFHLQVNTIGKSIPENVFLIVDGAEFRMKSESRGAFTFEFNNVRSNKQFQLRGASVYSEDFLLEAIPLPKVLRSEAYLDFPSYTRKPNETVLNRTQLVIPEGTQVRWRLDVKNARTSVVHIDSTRIEGSGNSDMLSIQRAFFKSSTLNVALQGQKGLQDSVQIKVSVVPDANPLISVENRVDSASGSYFFKGRLNDDYGFTKLRFVVQSNGLNINTEALMVDPDMLDQGFSFAWSPDTLIQNPGDELVYFFEVWDNDAINGAKSSRSKSWSIKVPTLDELNEESSERSSSTKASLSNSTSELDKMQKELEKLKRDLLQKKNPDWQDREALKDILEKQKKMMENLEKKALQQGKQQEMDKKFNSYSEDIMQKQEMIQEMFEKLFDEEFKEKYEEMSKLLDEMSKSEMLQKLEQMNLDNEQLEKELDRTLELFKQLELEKKVEDNLERLGELVKEQNELTEQTQDKKSLTDDLMERQEDLNEKMDHLDKELTKMDELNQALEEPQPLPDLSELSNGAKNDMREAKDELEKSNKGKAAKSQSEASDKMDEMKESLSSFQEQQSKGQQAENLEDMRQLLENIIDLSLNQEQVMEAFKPVKGNDPKYVELTKKQKNLVDDTRSVEDSLLALSKRVPQISKVINDEMSAVKFNMAKSLNYMSDQPPNREDQYKAMSLERQQYAMTSLNNLALLFDEIIKNMQKQMAPMSKGSGECDKPGSGKGTKPSAAEMKKMQESLNKQLEALKKALEKGENPNGKKPGQKPGSADGQSGLGGGMSKEMAQMAAQQAALRKQIREMSESLNKEGGGSGSNLKEIEKLMEQTEEDILFQKIDAQTMKRQQDILSKLLESEKADREREFEQRRESKTSTTEFAIPDDIWNKFETDKQKELELYKTLPPSLKPFYRIEVNRYFSNFQE